MAKRCKLCVMLRRFLPLLLPGALLVQCAPARPVTSIPLPEKARIQKSAEPVVSSRAELDASFHRWAETAQNPVNFRFSGELKSQWRKLISESTWGEFARSCATAYLETGQVSLTLEYRDHVLLRAALRDSAARARLTPELKEALQLAETFASQALRPGMSDFDKLLALHDALVSRSRYDADGGGNVRDLLRGGSGSCEAYSATICVLCELAGIPCRVVVGSADGPHAWNLVQLGGQWYHLDATWDDPVISGGKQQEVSHAYFCLSDAEISRSHSWNRPAYPASARTSAFYYRQTGAYYTSFESFWRAAMAAYRSGESRFAAYLAAYGSSGTFQKNLQRAAAPGTPRSIGWTGPQGSAGEVILNFKP